MNARAHERIWVLTGGRIPKWQIWLGLVGATALGLTLLVLAAGLLLLVVPAVMLGGLAWRLFVPRPPARPVPPRPGDGPVIEAEYRVLDDGKHGR